MQFTKYIISFALPLCLLLTSVEAQSYTDSLLQDWRDTDLDMEERIFALHQVAFHAINTDPEKALRLSDTLFIASQASDVPPKFKPASFIIKSYVYQQKGDFEKAVRMCESGIAVAKQIGEKRSESIILFSMGKIYAFQDKHLKSLEYYNRALEYYAGGYKKRQDSSAYITIQLSIAMEENNLGNFKKALEIYSDCLSKVRSANMKDNEMTILNSMGILFYDHDEYESATDYFKNSYALAISLRNRYFQSLVASNMGSNYAELDSFDAAYQYLSEAQILQTELGAKDQLAIIYNKLGNFYLQSQQYDSAIAVFEKGNSLARELDSDLDIIFNEVGKSQCYNLLGRPDLAIQSAKLAIKKANQAEGIDELNQKSQALKEMSISFDAQGEIDSALFYLKRHNELALEEAFEPMEQLRELVREDRKIKKLEYQKIQLTLEKNEILLESKKKENRFLTIIVSLVGLLLAITILYFLRLQKRRKQKFQEEKRYAAHKAATEKEDAERARFARDLHDAVGSTLTLSLFNLESLKHLVIDQSQQMKRVQHSISSVQTAMDDIRRISYDLMPKSLESGGLVSATKELMDKVREQDIEVQSRFPEPLEIFSKTEEVQLYRIIKELVSNTLRYANASSITLHMDITSKSFSLTYTDDGKGMNVKEAMAYSQSKGLGLVGLQDRSILVGAEHHIKSSPGHGFVFTLTKEI